MKHGGKNQVGPLHLLLYRCHVDPRDIYKTLTGVVGRRGFVDIPRDM